MKGDCEDVMSHYRKVESPPGKIKSLLGNLLEKEEEIAMYKKRLQELETAFCYNLELITERDLELSVLEKQLSNERIQLQEVIEERDELEDLIKTVDEKNRRKIQQLETRLALKDKELRELQRENGNNTTCLQRILKEVKQQHEKKIHKLNARHETEKKKLAITLREEMEDKEKCLLLEIDSLAEKLEKAIREKKEAEEDRRKLEYTLGEMEGLLQEKEALYLDELRRRSHGVHKEVQCGLKSQVGNKKVQAEPEINATESQTHPQEEDHSKKRITFLQEQNEVLKCIIKDLKKNRDVNKLKLGCTECSAVKAEVNQVSKKVETEIENFKKILEADQKQRAEEEALIQSLETSVACLKQRLLDGLQEKLKDFSGEDICTYTYNREIHNEIQVSLLEEKLTRKIDVLVTATEQEREKINEKLEEIKKECFEKMESRLREREEPSGENLLAKIRTEIQKLENKIESDMKNMVRNNSEKTKYDKNFQTALERPDFPDVLPARHFSSEDVFSSERLHYKNDFSPEKCISVIKCPQRKRPGTKDILPRR